jgi:hypothetical protein
MVAGFHGFHMIIKIINVYRMFPKELCNGIPNVNALFETPCITSGSHIEL